VAEQRYQAVLAVISDGLSVSQVASKVGVSRQTLHASLARYEAQGLEGLADRSHRPVSCPHQMGAEVGAAVLELRRCRRFLLEELLDLDAVLSVLSEMQAAGVGPEGNELIWREARFLSDFLSDTALAHCRHFIEHT
jgi:transposase-like protein